MNTQKTHERRHWHLEKSVSVSHIIATLSMLAALIFWATGQEKLISENKLSIEYLKHTDEQINQRIETLRSELRDDLRDINSKLDRIIESQSR